MGDATPPPCSAAPPGVAVAHRLNRTAAILPCARCSAPTWPSYHCPPSRSVRMLRPWT